VILTSGATLLVFGWPRTRLLFFLSLSAGALATSRKAMSPEERRWIPFYTFNPPKADFFKNPVSLNQGSGAKSDSVRVLRGGSWNNNINNTRNYEVTNRNRNDPNNRNNNIGFRLAQHCRRWLSHLARVCRSSFLSCRACRKCSPVLGPVFPLEEAKHEIHPLRLVTIRLKAATGL
jgi:hypothetical protein